MHCCKVYGAKQSSDCKQRQRSMLRQVGHYLQAIRSPEAAASPLCEGIVNAELTHQSIDIAVLVPKSAAYTQYGARGVVEPMHAEQAEAVGAGTVVMYPLMPASTDRPPGVRQPALSPPGVSLASRMVTLTPALRRA